MLAGAWGALTVGAADKETKPLSSIRSTFTARVKPTFSLSTVIVSVEAPSPRVISLLKFPTTS